MCSRSFEVDRSVWRARRITLRRYPYKLQHNEDLKPPDFDSHRDFANLVFNKMEEQHDWLYTVFWTDEAHFTLSGTVTSTIFEYGPQKIRMHLLRYPCHSLK
ncbi:uncharacterized protein TNIN_419631 [Trichonephila inaurata madagascariensis]|uniref:Transposase n=1 Tax=Trichonephila inaurata madagascariensis TaxID=2747483 RepID=A0A8X7CJF8_9ARAC|nr:uncharacterized protein TNIN_419631 [Trichonephila inaurata madagascariensis]